MLIPYHLLSVFEPQFALWQTNRKNWLLKIKKEVVKTDFDIFAYCIVYMTFFSFNIHLFFNLCYSSMYQTKKSVQYQIYVAVPINKGACFNFSCILSHNRW